MLGQNAHNTLGATPDSILPFIVVAVGIPVYLDCLACCRSTSLELWFGVIGWGSSVELLAGILCWRSRLVYSSRLVFMFGVPRLCSSLLMRLVRLVWLRAGVVDVVAAVAVVVVIAVVMAVGVADVCW